MPYDLISDGKQVPLDDRKYLLSPQDLAGLEILPEIIRSGVASLKIEGRLKTPEYVANITRAYRQALDLFRDESRVGDAKPSAAVPDSRHPSPDSRHYEIEMAFSRGLYTGWLGGIDNQQLVHARFGKKRGVYLGEVKRILRDGVGLHLEAPIKPGDGVVFDAGHPEEKEEGGRVYEVRGSELGTFTTFHVANSELFFGHGDINFSRVHVGDKVWKTDDPELNRRLRQTFEGDTPRFQRSIAMEVHGVVGQPLILIAHDELGHVGRSESAMPLAKAEKQPLTSERLQDQLGRLGGTPFKLGELNNELGGDVMLPVSELNRLRRAVVAELERQRALPPRWQLAAGNRTLGETGESKIQNPKSKIQLIVLVRNLAQLETALQCGVTTAYCDFENPRKYREAVTIFHTAFGCRSSPTSTPDAQPSIWVAPPRIFKMGEEWTLEQVRSCNADGYLVRNYDHLKYFANDRRIGDFSLNIIANRFAAEYFTSRFGLERVTASYDLNFQQLEALLQAAPPAWFEITIHQHMPMFHMEHCVFCAFLSHGKDYRDCGRPCDKHDVKLRDRVGMEHPLKADVGCRNTVFNARAQTGAEYVERMLALGVRHFRVEFVNETPAEVALTISKYRQLLRGEISGAQLWRELKLHHQLGVTRGQIGR
jgi:putative protease